MSPTSPSSKTSSTGGSPKVQLHRLGSDPEFVFFSPLSESKGRVVPAEIFVSNNKNTRLASFIGTDGHPATAEIRPAPARNVGWHLIKIAAALSAVNEFVEGRRRHPKYHDLQVIAQPHLLGEALGGHVHVSLWYNEPLTAYALNHLGYVGHTGGGDGTRVLSAPPHSWDRGEENMWREYKSLVLAGKALSVEEAVYKMHWLVAFFEDLIFKEHRGPRNGITDALFRVQKNERPEQPEKGGYFRFEYRYPSTWLYHPALAYCYLGLVKLAVLNWHLIPSYGEYLRQSMAMETAHPGGVPLRVKRETFWRRFREVWESGDRRLSADLNNLANQLDAALSAKMVYPLKIDFAAWNLFEA